MTQTKKKEPLDKWLHVKVSLTQREDLKKMAAQRKITLSDYVRLSLDKKATKIAPRQTRASRKADPKLLASLGKIGSNLNQIGRWVNRYKNAAEAVEVLAALSSIDRSLKALVPRQPSEKKEADDVSTTI